MVTEEIENIKEEIAKRYFERTYPEDALMKIIENTKNRKLRLILDILPDPAVKYTDDLFRVYSVIMFKELSKFSDITFYYMDVYGTLMCGDMGSAREISQRIHAVLEEFTGLKFNLIFESDVLSTIIKSPYYTFFTDLFKILENINIERSDPFPSNSLPIKLVLLLELTHIPYDGLVMMDQEYECFMKGYDIFESLKRRVRPGLFRTFYDYEGHEHFHGDMKRYLFPTMDQGAKDIYRNLINYDTPIAVLNDWVKKVILPELSSIKIQSEVYADIESLDRDLRKERIGHDEYRKIVAKGIEKIFTRYKDKIKLSLQESEFAIPMENYQQVFDTIGDKTRFGILQLLAEKPRHASEIAELLNIKLPTVLHHLNKLKDVDLVMYETGSAQRKTMKIWKLRKRGFYIKFV